MENGASSVIGAMSPSPIVAAFFGDARAFFAGDARAFLAGDLCARARRRRDDADDDVEYDDGRRRAGC